MMRSYENHVRDVPNVTIGIVSPDGRDGMLQNAKEFAELGIPVHLRSRPGHAAVQRCRAARLHRAGGLRLTVNDYESNLLQERTGWNEAGNRRQGEGLHHHPAARKRRGPSMPMATTHRIPPAHERRVTDPTGCGDAFRAGLIFGIEKGYDWMTIGRMGNLMGALKVEHPGTQNQRFDYERIRRAVPPAVRLRAVITGPSPT